MAESASGVLRGEIGSWPGAACSGVRCASGIGAAVHSAEVTLTATAAQLKAAGGCCRKALKLVCPDLAAFVPVLLLLPFLVRLLNALGNAPPAALTILLRDSSTRSVVSCTVLVLLVEGTVLWGIVSGIEGWEDGMEGALLS